MQFFKCYKFFFILLLGFFLGASLSSGLLFYSGKELVNVFVYFALVVVIPFFISLFSFILFLVLKKNISLYKHSFLFGIFFSLGAMFSLVFIVTTRDIAFGWATTINISSHNIYDFVSFISFWKSFCSSCIPSFSLVKISHFARLGSGVSKEQIDSAVLLGQWWRFLALSIFFYGVLFRGILYLLVLFFSRKKEVRFESLKEDEEFKEVEIKKTVLNPVEKLNVNIVNLLGYGIDKESLKTLNIKAKNINSFGGMRSFNKDSELLKSLKGNTLIVVKSWEPPILDFIDLLEFLDIDAKLYIYMFGLNKDIKSMDVDVWRRKLMENGYGDIEVLV